MLLQLTGGKLKHHNNPISKFSTLTHTTFHMTGLRYHIFEANLTGNKSLLDIPLYPMWVDSKRALYSCNLTYYTLFLTIAQTKCNMYLTWTLLDKKWWLNVIQKKPFLNLSCSKSFASLHKISPNYKFSKKSFSEHLGISSKFVGVFNVHIYDKLNSKSFHPYSILTGDGWIRGLKCVKGIRENVLLYIL